MLLSVLAARLGTALWKRAPGSRDIVFADLMLWGWLRRCRTERRLARAETLLGADAEGHERRGADQAQQTARGARPLHLRHSQRVTRHAERIARAMGLGADDVAKVRTAAALHDVGKLHTPRDLLNKPGRLTEESRGRSAATPVTAPRWRGPRRPGDRRDDPPPPRAARRERLPGRARRRGDPARRPHHRRRRHLRRDHLRPPLPPRVQPQARARRARARGRDAARRRCGRGLRRLLPRPAPPSRGRRSRRRRRSACSPGSAVSPRASARARPAQPRC